MVVEVIWPMGADGGSLRGNNVVVPLSCQRKEILRLVLIKITRDDRNPFVFRETVEIAVNLIKMADFFPPLFFALAIDDVTGNKVEGEAG